MLLLTLLLSASHAATPRLLGCLSAHTPSSTTFAYAFPTDGYLALVVENPDASPDGDFGYAIAGITMGRVPAGTTTDGYYGYPLEGGVPWTELQFPMSAAWGPREIRLEYNSRDGMVVDPDDDTACLYAVPAPAPSRGRTIGSWCWGPSDTTVYSTTFTAATAGRLVATRTSTGATGGGGVSVYVDGESQLLLLTSDADNFTPEWTAAPLLAGGAHSLDIAGDDTDFRDNTGTRCVTLTYTSP